MSKLIDKAFTKPNINFRHISYGISDYTTSALSDEEQYQLSTELKKSKKLLFDNPAFKKMMKEIEAKVAEHLTQDIHDIAHDHQQTIDLQIKTMKTKVDKEVFIQNVSKKLTKKEIGKLKKLLDGKRSK